MILADWPYEEMQQLAAPKDVLRLGLRNTPLLARLEIRDPDFAAAIDDRSLSVDRSGAADRRARLQVIGWTLVATVSLVLVAVLIVPAMAVAPCADHSAAAWSSGSATRSMRKCAPCSTPRSWASG